MFKIRYAEEADKSFWFNLDKHLTKDEFELKIRDRRGYVFSLDDNPVGVMRYNLFWDTVPFLTLIYIKERYRGRGLGKQAVLHWENEMRVKGHTMLMTSTQADEEAQHFYRKLGYLERGSLFLDNTPLAQAAELFMIKVLDKNI